MPDIEPDSVTSVTRITTHAEDGVALLPRQFRGKVALEALLRSWMDQAQDVEDALWDLLQCTLETAIGDALDQIGALVAFERGALEDEDYRVMLRAIVRARQSSGTGEDLHAVTGLTLAPDAISFSAREGYASWLIEPHSPLPFSAEAMLLALNLTKAGGVQLQLVTPPRAEADLFTFSSNRFFAETSSAKGLSDTGLASGGHLTGVIE